ncbi:hypothetical protein NWQ33_03180 [Mycoplasmopsis cynos]|nr:hypothetical protein [Mycoplasmopsis cynos]
MSNKKFIRNYGTIKQNKNLNCLWMGKFMKANYNEVWKLLIDKNMKKLIWLEKQNLPPSIWKWAKGEFVSIPRFYIKLQKVLDTTIGEIVTLIRGKIMKKIF